VIAFFCIAWTYYWLPVLCCNESSVIPCCSAVLLIFSGNLGDCGGFLYTSSAGIGIWSSVWYSFLHTGDRDNVDKYHVDIDGVQWQRDIQYTSNILCIRLQVSRLHRQYVFLPTKGTLHLRRVGNDKYYVKGYVYPNAYVIPLKSLTFWRYIQIRLLLLLLLLLFYPR